MSCYFRHIEDILQAAGITVTKENRKQVDEAVHQAVGVAYKNCPVTWKKIKEDIKGDSQKRQVLIEQLRRAVH
jgi:hypothetical protein